MTCNEDMRVAAAMLHLDVSELSLAKLEADLDAELNSIELFDDAAITILTLKNLGFKIGVCSNLAKPYASPIERLLPIEPDGVAWSFKIGAVKPDATIYQYVCDELGCSPGQVLMVGDTMKTDVEGPQRFGMEALHIKRSNVQDSRSELANLTDLLSFL